MSITHPRKRSKHHATFIFLLSCVIPWNQSAVQHPTYPVCLTTFTVQTIEHIVLLRYYDRPSILVKGEAVDKQVLSSIQTRSFDSFMQAYYKTAVVTTLACVFRTHWLWLLSNLLNIKSNRNSEICSRTGDADRLAVKWLHRILETQVGQCRQGVLILLLLY